MYCKCGCLELGVKLFSDTPPPERTVVTYNTIIAAVGMNGDTDLALSYFNEMQFYKINSCVVDMYSRSGQVEQAWEFVRAMPVEPESDVVGCVLGGCRVSRRLDVAEIVGRWILEKRLEDLGYCVLRCNIYASYGRWDDEEKVRRNMKDRGIVKYPGYSWIQTDSTSVHYFTAQGRTNILFDEMSQILDVLFFQMKDPHKQSLIAIPCSDLNSENRGLFI